MNNFGVGYSYKKFCRVAVGFFLALYAICSSALDVYIAIPDQVSEGGRKKVDELKILTDSKTQLWSEVISARTAAKLDGQENLILTLGEKALKTVLDGKGNSRTVAVFIRRPQYESIIKGYPSKKRKISAIYSDPSPIRQIALARVLFGPNTKTGIINTTYTNAYIDEYAKAAKDFGVDLKIIDIHKIKNIGDLITHMSNVESVLLIKDPDLLKKVSLDEIRHRTLNVNQQAIIGFGESMVSKGGLATTFSSINDTVLSVERQVEHAKSNDGLLPNGYTDTYTIAINDTIVNILDLFKQNKTEVKENINTLIQGKRNE